MIDVLEAYRICNDACNQPDLSEDEFGQEEGEKPITAHWSPIAMRKLWGSRRLRADTVRYIFKSPKSMLECDNMQVECVDFGKDPFPIMRFKRYDMWSLFRDKIRSDTVIVAVEATAICHNDVLVRQGMLNENVPLPFVPGSNFVGIVHYCGPDVHEEYGFKEGSRVASLIKWGGNARYVSVPAHQLVHVPKRVDASEAATVLSTYVPAFQALQHGKIKASRYSPASLNGKIVLITDGSSAEGQAAIRLAYWAGALEVYAIGKRDLHNRLKALGATPLYEDPDDWLPLVEGLMDVVIHFEFPTNLDAVRAAMKRKGRLVCYARPSMEKREPGFSWVTEIKQFCEQSSLSMIKRSSLYDPMFSFDYYADQFKRDLAFLFALLVQRQIRPKIDRYITLKGVPAAHHDLQFRGVDGAIICEPWKD